MPIVFDVCGEPRKPIVLVGNKSDCMEAEGDRMNELLAIMDEYPEVETCIEVNFNSIAKSYHLQYKKVILLALKSIVACVLLNIDICLK